MTYCVPPGAAPEETGALIDHIVARYHRVHRAQLPTLLRCAQRVEARHARDPAGPHGLADLIALIGWEMGVHMEKEDQGLFRMMRDARDEHAAWLHELLARTQGQRAPGEPCDDCGALCDGVARFAADLAEHIRLENEVLFPRFGAQARAQGA